MIIKRLVILLMVFTLAATSAFALTGDGTEETPYQITNLDDLIELSGSNALWHDYFIQTADIDASSTSELNEGAGFSPIGPSSQFGGSYDGQGFTISNLYINRPSTTNIGLFGSIYDAKISNLGLVDIDISGSLAVGGLVGCAQKTPISNCYVTGSVSGTTKVGGLVGEFTYQSTISNCYTRVSVTGTGNYTGGLVGTNSSEDPISESYATGTVVGHDYVGGLVGNADSAIINNSYATGAVSGDDYVGGLVGNSTAGYNKPYSTISNNYATGTVSGDSRVGGLVGYSYYSSTISNNYATGSVSGDDYVGGLVGFNNGSVSNSFWDMETSGQTTSAGGTGKTTEEMKDPNTYPVADWDITTETGSEGPIWVIRDKNQGYPYLTWAEDFVEYTSETLPVTLSSFTAIQTSNNLAQINWVTASESSVLGYNLYRAESENQTDALRVTATMIEATNSATGNNYSYVDAEVEFNIEYHYWLQTNDLDGTTEMFGPVTVKISSQENNDIEEMLLGTQMFANYPNPFNPSTTISFSVAESQDVTIDVYNVKGQLVKRVFNSNVAEINVKHSVVWNGQDSDGQSVASGIYFTIMKAGNKKFTNKAILLK
jgi:hypothetical protein